MTIFTIPAALPAAPNNTNRAPTDAHTETEASSPSFSSVLTDQQSPKSAPEAATPVESGAGKGKDLTQAAPETVEDTEEVPAELAAEQGLSLPQIALTIAAEAALAIAAQQPAKASIAQADTSLPAAALAGRDLPTMLTDTVKAEPTPAGVIAAATRKDALPQAALPLPETRLAASDKPVALPAGFVPVAAPAAALHQTELNARKPINLLGAKPAAVAHDLTRSGEPSLGKSTAPDLSAAIASQANKAVVANTAQADLNASLQTGSIAGASTIPAALLSGKTGAPAGTGVQFAMPGIATPLQNPQWASDFGRQFITLAKGGHNMPHTAELRLDPPELGPLRISINISDNVAHAIFTSPHAAVRQTVENSLPQLQQLLAQAGISLGQTSVNDQGQQESSFSESFGGSNKSANAAGATGGTVEAAVMQPTTRSRTPDALVDTFA